MIQKRDEAFKASKREQARIIKEMNEEIASKSEELDLEMIKDDTVDAMLKMQLIADKPIDDKRNYRIKEKGFGEENNVMLWFQRKISMIWPVGLTKGR